MRRKGFWRKATGLLMCAALILGDCPAWAETENKLPNEEELQNGDETQKGSAEETEENTENGKQKEAEPEPSYSMILSQTDFTYNGEEHCPGAVVYYGDEALSSDAYELSYLNNVNAGSASVTAAVDGRTLTESFTIEPKEAVVKVHSASKTYGDPDPDFTGSITGLVGEDSLGEVSYVRTEETQDAGTVGLTAVVSEANPNYSYEIEDGVLTIGKRDLTIASTLAEVTYGEELPSNVLSYLSITGGSLAYSDTLSGIGLDYNWKTRGKEAGSHTMGIELSGESPNYSVSVQKTEYTILPRTVLVTWPEESEVSFDGTEKTYEPVLANFAYEDAGITPVLEDSCNTEGGTYTCRITGLEGEGASNYCLPESGIYAEWKILPIDLAMSLESVEKVYDGEAADLPITAEADPDRLPQIRTFFRRSGEGEFLEGSPVEAGVYDIRAVSGQTCNYKETQSIFEAAVTIGKREASVVIPDAEKAYKEEDPEFEPGGFENVVEDDADLANVDLQAVRTGEDEDPGLYEGVLDLTAETKAALESLNNYEIEIAKGNFTIRLSEDLTVSAEDVQAVYDGEMHTIAPQASQEGAQILYYNDESGAYDLEEAPAAVNVDEGILEVRFKASLFGYEDAFGSASVEILPADVVVQAIGNTGEYTYTGEEITVSGVQYQNVPEDVEIRTVEGVSAEIIEKDVKAEEDGIGEYRMGLDENSFIAAGDAADNYNVTFEVTDGSLKILPAVPEFSVSFEERPYNAQPAEPAVQIGLAEADAEKEPVIRYSFGTDEETFEEGLPVHAGTYTVKAVLEPLNDNYEGAEFLAECVIIPMDVEVSGEAQDKIYDGKTETVIRLSAQEVPDVCSLTFEEAAGSFEDPNAGSGRKVVLDADSVEISVCSYGAISDYHLILPEEMTANIELLTAELAWSADALPYNGAEQTVTCEVTNRVEGDAFEIEYSSNAALERGSYTAVVTGLGNPNYELPQDTGHDFEIVMGEAAIRISGTRLALDWNQTVQTAEGYSFTVTDGPEGAGKEIFVSLKEGREAKAEGEDVGTYYMGLTQEDFAVESTNYEVTVAEFEDGCLSILKASKMPELTAVRINGEAAEPDVLGAYTGKIGDVLTVEMEDLGSEDFDLSCSDAGVAVPADPAGLNLTGYGEALVTVSVRETDNYLAQELTFHIRVGKKEGKVALAGGEVLVKYLSETAITPEDAAQAASYTLISLTPEICLVAGEDGVPSSQAECSGSGLVYGRTPGEGSIEIRVPENDRYTEAVLVVSVTVEKADRRVQFAESEVRTDPTAEAFSILPQSDGDETTVVWESADPAIAAIDADGMITPMGVETEGVQITAVFEENEHYKEAQDSFMLILAHEWILAEEEHLDPTCTEKGYTGVYHCSNPGCTEVRYETEIDALGHELVEVMAEEANDSEPGMDAHWACSRCGALFADENGEEEVTEAQLTINHVIIPVQAISVYDGKKHRPKGIRAVAEGSVLMYSVDGENFEAKAPGFRDAGNYTVYVKAEHPEYRDSEVGSVVLTISPKTIGVTGEQLKAEKTFDGTIMAEVEGELTADGVLEGEDAELSYEKMEASFDFAKPGKHTVTVCITGLTAANPNYRLENDTVTLQIEGIIKKAPVVTPAGGHEHGHDHGNGYGSGNGSGGSGSTGGSSSGNTGSGSTSSSGSGSTNSTGSVSTPGSGNSNGTANSGSSASSQTNTPTSVPEKASDPAEGNADQTPTPTPKAEEVSPTPTLTASPVPTETVEEADAETTEEEAEASEKAEEENENKEEEPESRESSLPILPIGLGLAALLLLIVLFLKKKAG